MNGQLNGVIVNWIAPAWFGAQKRSSRKVDGPAPFRPCSKCRSSAKCSSCMSGGGIPPAQSARMGTAPAMTAPPPLANQRRRSVRRPDPELHTRTRPPGIIAGRDKLSLLGGPEIASRPRPSPDGHLLAFFAVDRGYTQVADRRVTPTQSVKAFSEGWIRANE